MIRRTRMRACDARASRRGWRIRACFGPWPEWGRDCSRNDADHPDRVGMGTADPPEYPRDDANPPVCVGMGIDCAPEYPRDDANVPYAASRSGLPDDVAGVVGVFRGLWSVRRAADTRPRPAAASLAAHSGAIGCSTGGGPSSVPKQGRRGAFRPTALRPTFHGTIPHGKQKVPKTNEREGYTA